MFGDNILAFESCLKISVKIFLNEMSVQHVNALRFNWKKIKQYIINACLYIRVKYKEPVTFVSIKVLRI